MRRTVNYMRDWINVAFCFSLAGVTNHSLGDIVYRKVAAVDTARHPNPQTESQARTGSSTGDESEIRITRIDKQGDAIMAVIDSPEGLISGELVEAQRLVHQGSESRPIWVTTGVLKVAELRPNYALASAQEDSTYDSSIYFKSQPGIMVGDRVVSQAPRIIANIKLLPTVTIPYKELFLDPKSFPLSFELSEEGMETLKAKARVFVEARVGSLIVEAHTDSEGSREANQMESYQRALTIRQVLIDELALDPERVLAVGLGESEPLQEQHLPGKKDQARRIILKASGHDLR